MCSRLLTDITKEHGEEDEAVRGPQQHYGQVHPKIEDLKDLRLGQRQDEDTTELC